MQICFDIGITPVEFRAQPRQDQVTMIAFHQVKAEMERAEAKELNRNNR